MAELGQSLTMIPGDEKISPFQLTREQIAIKAEHKIDNQKDNLAHFDICYKAKICYYCGSDNAKVEYRIIQCKDCKKTSNRDDIAEFRQQD